MKNIIEIKNLKFKYSGAGKNQWHLNNVSLDFEKGKWTTILGPNGSGKSTLIKSIVRINKYKSGSISLIDKDVKSYKPKEFARNVAYIPQEVEIPHGTSVYDFVSFGRNPYLGITGSLSKKDKEKIKEAMIQTSVWDWKEKSVDELSGGQKQKVLIAMIIAQDADIILLDEPTTYLDIRNQYELLEMMHGQHAQGKTIITILHDINQAVQYSDNIHIMKEGKVYASGKPMKVVTNKILKEVYNVDAILYKDKDRRYLTDVRLVDFNNKGKHIHDHAHEVKSEIKVK